MAPISSLDRAIATLNSHLDNTNPNLLAILRSYRSIKHDLMDHLNMYDLQGKKLARIDQELQDLRHETRQNYAKQQRVNEETRQNHAKQQRVIEPLKESAILAALSEMSKQAAIQATWYPRTGKRLTPAERSQRIAAGRNRIRKASSKNTTKGLPGHLKKLLDNPITSEIIRIDPV